MRRKSEKAMGATKKDDSGVFDAEWNNRRAGKAAVMDQQFELGPHGITFLTDSYLSEWTEVGVEMKFPQQGDRGQRPIDCRGVVVQCVRSHRGRGFEVALLFLDLSKQAQIRLLHSAADAASASISISR